MSDPIHALEPELAARLSARVCTLLERCIPFGRDYSMNLGMLMGLQFARRLMDEPTTTIEQAHEALNEAIRRAASCLGDQIKAQNPDLHVKMEKAYLTPELIAEIEAHSTDDPDDIPFDDNLLRELCGEELPPESGAA